MTEKNNHSGTTWRTCCLVLAASVSIGIGTAHAQTYDPYAILGAFNAIVPGNYSVGVDTVGHVIIGTVTNTNSSTPQFSTAPAVTDLSTTLTNSANNTTTTFQNVNIVNVGTGVTSIVSDIGNINVLNNVPAASITANGGSVLTNSPSFTMTPFVNALNGLQTSLGNLTTNSSAANVGGTLTFSLGSNSSQIAVFNITTAQIQSATAILFTGTAQSVVINVTGLTMTDTASFNPSAITGTGLALNSVIWNFTNATTLNLNNSWEGSLLAGSATVTKTGNGDVEGSLYALNFSDTQELHDFTYLPTTPPTTPSTPNTPVPEPASLMLLASGLGALVGVRRRGKSSGRATR